MKVSKQLARKLGIAVPTHEQRRTAQEASQAKSQAHGQKEARERSLTILALKHGLPEPVFEYPFAADAWLDGRKLCSHEKTKAHRCLQCGARRRQWRFDLVFDGWLVIEQVGGVWTGGHHSRGNDQIADMEKRNHAALLGYVVLEFTPQQVESGEAFAFAKRVLDSGEHQ